MSSKPAGDALRGRLARKRASPRVTRKDAFWHIPSDYLKTLTAYTPDSRVATCGPSGAVHSESSRSAAKSLQIAGRVSRFNPAAMIVRERERESMLFIG